MSLMQSISTGKEQRVPRLMIYGAEGVGKSSFAALAPSPIFIQTEDDNRNFAFEAQICSCHIDDFQIVFHDVFCLDNIDFLSVGICCGVIIINTVNALCKEQTVTMHFQSSINFFATIPMRT